VANFAFGLINTEKEDGFLWLCERLEELRQDLHVPAPTVFITDKEMALKNALMTVFPSGQQQLCVHHIKANIRARIRSKRKSGDGASDGEAEAADGDDDLLSAQADTDAVDNNLAAHAVEQEVAEIGDIASLPAADPQTREGMFRAWQQVIYAEDEGDFFSAWEKMKAAYNSTQNHILHYISKEYMPYREQWARCYIKRYRNFGQRVNSPVETAHKDVKSFLITGTSDLLYLHNAICLMLEKRERDHD
jgi:hypothetical protein